VEVTALMEVQGIIFRARRLKKSRSTGVEVLWSGFLKGRAAPRARPRRSGILEKVGWVEGGRGQELVDVLSLG
jgi:hypothetical protein